MQTRRRAPLLAAVTVVALGLVAVAATLLGVAPWQSPTAGAAGPVPRFVDETATSGLTFTYDGPFAHAAGGGVAVFDCDDDGFEDVFLAGGEGPAALFRNASTRAGELRFERLASATTDLTAVNGAYPIDVDSDGHIDLVTLRNGENVMLGGLGDCRFEPANEAWGVAGGAAQTQAFSAAWEAGSALPTLAFGNYLAPGNFDLDSRCQPNELLRPVVTTTATAAKPYGPPLELSPSYCTLSLLFSDWSGSGRPDLRVSNDRAYYRQSVGQEQLWRVAPGEEPRLYEAADGWARVQVEGMGIASRDLTGDGLPEIYLASQSASRLQTLAEGAARPAYRDIGLDRGVNVAHPFAGDDLDLPSTAWHPEFADVNNDGFVDLFVSKGNVTAQPDFAQQDPSNLLLGQPDGTFREVADSAGILTFDRGRGAALADFNVDGWPDLVESFYGAPIRVWRNTGPEVSVGASGGRWIELRLGQSGSNGDAIGAVVEVRFDGGIDRRELTIGGGHAGGRLGWLHVGLGGAATADVHVTWPGGGTTDWPGLSSNAFYLLERGAPALLWAPAGGAE